MGVVDAELPSPRGQSGRPGHLGRHTDTLRPSLPGPSWSPVSDRNSHSPLQCGVSMLEKWVRNVDRDFVSLNHTGHIILPEAKALPLTLTLNDELSCQKVRLWRLL